MSTKLPCAMPAAGRQSAGLRTERSSIGPGDRSRWRGVTAPGGHAMPTDEEWVKLEKPRAREARGGRPFAEAEPGPHSFEDQVLAPLQEVRDLLGRAGPDRSGMTGPAMAGRSPAGPPRGTAAFP